MGSRELHQIDVNVAKLNGEQLGFTALLTETVRSLKDQIAIISGVPVTKQLLSLAANSSEVLDDAKYLHELVASIGLGEVAEGNASKLDLLMVVAKYRSAYWVNNPKEEDHIEAVFKGHKGFVYDVCFQEVKNLVASASEDGSAIIWDLAQGEVTADSAGAQKMQYSPKFRLRPRAIPTPCNSVQFSDTEDGLVLMVGTANGDLSIWDAATGQLKERVTNVVGTEPLIWLHPIGADQIMCGSGPKTGAIDPTPGSKMALVSTSDWSISKTWSVPGGLHSYCHQPLTNAIYCGQESVVSVLDLEGSMKGTCCVASGDVRSLSPHPTLKRLMVAVPTQICEVELQEDGLLGATIRVINESTGGWAFGGVWCARYHPAAELILSAEPHGETIKVFGSSDTECLHTFRGHTDYVFRFEFNRDGSRMLSAAGDSQIIMWNLPSKIIQKQERTESTEQAACPGKDLLEISPHFVGFLPAGDVFCVVGSDSVKLVSTKDLITVAEYKQNSSADGGRRTGALSSDGQLLCVNSGETQISWFSLAGGTISQLVTAQEIDSILDCDSSITSLAISQDTKRLLVTDCKNRHSNTSTAISVDIQDIHNLKVLVIYREHHRRVFSGSIAGDNITAVTGSHGGAQVWNMETGETLASFSQGCFCVSFVTFRPTTIVGDDGANIFFFDYAAKECVDRLDDFHEAQVNDIVPVEGGLFLLTASDDCSVRMVSSQDKQLACKFSSRQAKQFKSLALHTTGSDTTVLATNDSGGLFVLKM